MGSDKQTPKGYNMIWMQFANENDRHQLFFKEHAIRNQDPEHPRGRTMFLLNVPPYVTELSLTRRLSKQVANVERTSFTSSTGFKTAYVVFKDESGLDKALELPSDFVLNIHIRRNRCHTGIQKWAAEYNSSICGEEKLKKDIEDYMNNYDKEVLDKKTKEKEAEEVEGEDGWVTVSGTKKRGEFALARKESTINKLQQVDEQKKKKKQLLNFYTFQIREEKKQNLAELRKKFELDKQRLQELKSKRTFKPF